MNSAAVVKTGLLLAFLSAALACLPSQGGPSTLLNIALTLTEELGRLSSRGAASEEKPTALDGSENTTDTPSNSSYKSFSFPSNCPVSCIRQFLKLYNYRRARLRSRVRNLEWNIQTNLSKANRRNRSVPAYERRYWGFSKRSRLFAGNVTTDGLTDSEKRQIELIKKDGMTMNKTESRILGRSKRQMMFIYNHARIVRKNKQQLIGQSDVKKFFRNNRDYDALVEVWSLWRLRAGAPQRPFFKKLIPIYASVAKRKNFTDYGRMQRLRGFEDPNFDEKLMDMFAKILPLYRELHAYARFKLSSKYPNRFDPKGPIPAHILGDPWGQSWQNIFDILKPYPNALSTDVTAEMQRQNWTVERMFKTTEAFFVSLGLPKMVPKFWKLSMLKKPKDRRVVCHASAWDFLTGDDYRIKMCTEVNQGHLRTIHHEMGHILYFMLYSHLPLAFRKSANEAFHEAVGDTIALSVMTIPHLAKLGLIKSNKVTKEVEINTLMRMAVQRVALLPYTLLLDAWRWRVYNGTIKESDYNKGWWKLRRDLQGVKPPVARSEKDFDPGAKFHVAFNKPYIRYFVGIIMQFQFYEAMCKASGHQGPLYMCDFYQSKAAGDLLRSTLSLGLSKPWPEAMRKMTGQPEVSTDALRRYFAPLLVWLKDFRKKHNYAIGW